MTRTGASALVFSLTLAALTLTATAPGQRDNILVILADDVGVDNVGVYQEAPDPPPTPNIDALAARGVLFRNVWSNPVCSPTRAGIMTGRHAFRTGVGTGITPICSGILDPDEVTIPEMLDRAGAGYAHGYIGKWHLSHATNPNAPNQHGWSHFAGMLTAQVQDYYNWPRTVNGASSLSTTYATTKQVDDAVEWINRQNTPWLCFLSFNAAHRPFHEPPPQLHTQTLPGNGETTPLYRAMVEAMDTEIGRLLNALGPALQRTNVIFLGDNGTPAEVTLPPFLPLHAKGWPYEGGAGVPMIVAGPAVRSPGREESALVATLDLFTTIADLAGIDGPAQIPPWLTLDSVSLAPYLGNPAQAPIRTGLFTERWWGSNFGHALEIGYAAVRNDRYKLIQFQQPRRDEFYDLVADPFEQVDLLTNGSLSTVQAQNHLSLDQRLRQLHTPTSGLFRHGASLCVGSNGSPDIAASGRASLGQQYEISLRRAPPGSPVWMMVGSSYTTLGPNLPLPYDLSQLGAGAGCMIYGSIDDMLGATTNGEGSAVFSFPVPNELSLVGRTVHHGWLVHDPAAPGNALGLVTSGAIAARLGF